MSRLFGNNTTIPLYTIIQAEHAVKKIGQDIGGLFGRSLGQLLLLQGLICVTQIFICRQTLMQANSRGGVTDFEPKGYLNSLPPPSRHSHPAKWFQ
jgi:hypothetical protein